MVPGSVTPMMVTTIPMMVNTLVGLSAPSPGAQPAGAPSQTARTFPLPGRDDQGPGTRTGG